MNGDLLRVILLCAFIVASVAPPSPVVAEGASSGEPLEKIVAAIELIKREIASGNFNNGTVSEG